MHTVLRTYQEVEIRFSEVDSMNIVWHGNYVKYLEDGREAFSRQYGMGYQEALEHGYYLPIVSMEINYKQSLYYGDKVRVETQFVETDAATVTFTYQLYRQAERNPVATAKTVQVFVDQDRQLQLREPAFFTAWKEKWLYASLLPL